MTESGGSIEITARKEVELEDGSKEPRAATIYYDFGENLAKAVEKFGEDVVFTNFRQSAKITAQAIIRRALERGDDEEAIQAQFANWRPGVSLERTVDPKTAIKQRLRSMPQEERLAFLRELEASLEG